ncbi:DUF5348 domain-containing protein [Piscibacillus sp. B03]|uniref:DUF5348 domain-containing protein n=1 Tax=Piscibacillus sp. B03 TaxID=3457430 RepID=UPI003FCDD2AB
MTRQNISIEEAKTTFKQLQWYIQNLIRQVGDELEHIDYDPNNIDETFMVDEFERIITDLEVAENKIDYIQRPIIDKGLITKNELGRYELPSGNYLTSGSICEILAYDDYFDCQMWLKTRIEHNGEDYYATALGSDKLINGMMVRIRK